MSYPYDLDLFFGSEKSTADSFSTVLESNSDHSLSLPKTKEEFYELMISGLASGCVFNSISGIIEGLDPAVESTLPQNLKGIVILDGDTIIIVNYSIQNGQIIVQNPEEYISTHVYLILKQNPH